MIYKNLFRGYRTFWNRPYYQFCQFPPRDIDLNYRDQNLTLNIEFPNGDKKIYFIHEKYTFANLREILFTEYPNMDIQVDFSKCNKEDMHDESSNISNFLNGQNPNTVQFQFDHKSYNLKNTASSGLNQNLSNLISDLDKKNNNVLHFYNECRKHQINESHSGTLAYFLNQYQQKISNLNKGKITDTEVNKLAEKCLPQFSDRVNQDIDDFQSQLNAINNEIEILVSQKEKIEKDEEKISRRYINLLFGVSVAQLGSFIYAIFCVEWLGWDIIEPITYTVQQFTVLAGVLFFMRNKKMRSFDSIIEISRTRRIKKNYKLNQQYQSLIQQIQFKQNQKEILETKINIYLNRKNYSQFIR